MVRIVIPTNGNSGLNENISPIFGRAPYLTYVDVDGDVKNVFAKQNAGLFARGGAGIASAQEVITNGANVVIAQQIGPNAFDILEEAGIKIFMGSGTVKKLIDDYKENKLSEINISQGFGRGMGRGRGLGRGGGFGRGLGRGFGGGRWR